MLTHTADTVGCLTATNGHKPPRRFVYNRRNRSCSPFGFPVATPRRLRPALGVAVGRSFATGLFDVGCPRGVGGCPSVAHRRSLACGINPHENRSRPVGAFGCCLLSVWWVIIPPPPPILGERASGVCIPKRRKKRGKCAFAPSPIWQNRYFIQLTTSGNSFRCSSLVVQLTVFALSPSEEHFFVKKCSDKGAKTYKIVMFCLIVFGITIRYAHKCAFAHARQLRLSARASYAAFGGVLFGVLCFFFGGRFL